MSKKKQAQQLVILPNPDDFEREGEELYEWWLDKGGGKRWDELNGKDQRRWMRLAAKQDELGIVHDRGDFDSSHSSQVVGNDGLVEDDEEESESDDDDEDDEDDDDGAPDELSDDESMASHFIRRARR